MFQQNDSFAPSTLGDHAMNHEEIVVTGHAPKPIGPYSQAARANGFLFTA